jgi:hypothetical protein
MLTDFLSGRPETLLELLSPLANEIPASHGDDDSSESQLHEVDPYSVASYWAAQVEALQNFAARRQLTPCASEAS